MNNRQDIGIKTHVGDEKTFEQMFRSYYAGMCGYAFKYLEDMDLSEEVVQEVFLNFWDKRTTLEVRGCLEAYLYRSVRNACLNHLKSQKVRSNYVQAQVVTLMEEERRTSDKMVELELQQKIDDSIEELPPERKRIFKLSREEGLKYKEIADQLGISVKTVEAQMGKALKYLRKNLAEYLSVIVILVYSQVWLWDWLLKLF